MNERIMELHNQGFSIPQIKTFTGEPLAYIHALIVDTWAKDKAAYLIHRKQRTGKR